MNTIRVNRRFPIRETARPLWQAAFALVLGIVSVQTATAQPAQFDVAVYTATPAGVIAATAAAREGAKVVLLEPGEYVGGMMSGGLGATDVGVADTIGGYALEFFRRIGRLYGKPVFYYFEPHAAEQAFVQILREAGVSIRYGQQLREIGGVVKTERRITGIRMLSGAEFEARVFIDAGYEGDLMARAGVSNVVGREPKSQYGESLAGVQIAKYHQFEQPVRADENGALLPEISAGARGEIGSGDRRVQAYTYRLCLTKEKGNQVPIPAPRNFDPKRYALLARVIAEFTQANRKPPTLGDLMALNPIPGNKFDVNSRGPFSTDYVGGADDYPAATYAQREKIRREHIEYITGLFRFLAEDPRVPESLRAEVRSWGLAKNEFTGAENWPYQFYIREGRRMVGDFVMTQADVNTNITKPDAIGLGSYMIDSHHVRRYVDPDGLAKNEGDVEAGVPVYQIPYRVLTPRASEITNLLVPVCVSASHVAYGTLRMEPVYMILGHAAGVAASMALDRPVQEVDAAKLAARLAGQGAIFSLKPKPKRGADAAATR